MSLNLTVTIPLETAAILRRAHDSRTADPDVDSALFTVANAVIDGVKALPWSITTSPASFEDRHFDIRDFSPYGVLTPPSSTYSKESTGISLKSTSHDYRDFSKGSSISLKSATHDYRDFAFSSSDGTCSRSTSGTTPYTKCSSSADSWWSAKEACVELDEVYEIYVDEFSIDICDIVNGEEETYYLAVTGDMTLEELSFRVEQVSGVPAKEMGLVWRGYRLNQPDAELEVYGISDGSKLHLLRRAMSVDTLPASEFEEEMPYRPLPVPGYEIVIETAGGKCIPVPVQAKTTTSELASSIFDKQGINPGLQRLVHRGNVIFDGHAYDMGEAHLIYTLEELGIGPETVVSLFFCNTTR